MLLIAFTSLSTISANDLNESEEFMPINNDAIIEESVKNEISESKIDTTLNTSDIDLFYKNGTSFTASLVDKDNNPLINETIIFKLNNHTYTRVTNENGIASLGINLIPGSYSITVIFEGNDKYNGATAINNILVKETISGENIIKYFKNGTQYYATFLDGQGNPLKNTNVTFNINGIFYTKLTDENGTAKLSINLIPDTYILTAIHPETNLNHSNTVTVLSNIQGEDLIKEFHEEQSFYAQFFDDYGNLLINREVTFNINGIFYTRTTNEYGIASLLITLNPNKYILTAIHPDNGLMESYSIEVYKDELVTSPGPNEIGGSVYYDEIINAAADLKIHIESYGTLPEYIPVGKYYVTVHQFVYLMAQAVNNQKSNNPIEIIYVSGPDNYLSDSIHGNLRSNLYSPVASEIIDYILTNGKVPDYIISTLYVPHKEISSVEKIPYNALIYSFAKLLNYYGNNNDKNPSFVYITNLLDEYGVTVTMKPSGIDGGNYEYKLYIATWLNYCPKCGYYGTLLNNPKGVPEGELTCHYCDSDWCGVSGIDKYPKNIYLTPLVPARLL